MPLLDTSEMTSEITYLWASDSTVSGPGAVIFLKEANSKNCASALLGSESASCTILKMYIRVRRLGTIKVVDC